MVIFDSYVKLPEGKFGRLIANGKAFIAALVELKELDSLAKWQLSGSTGEKPSSHLATIPLIFHSSAFGARLRTRESTGINNELRSGPQNCFAMDDVPGLLGGFKLI